MVLVLAFVCQNTSVIHTQVVDPSVSLTKIVSVQKHARIINVEIHVLALVEYTLNVEF